MNFCSHTVSQRLQVPQAHQALQQAGEAGVVEEREEEEGEVGGGQVKTPWLLIPEERK